MGKNIGTPNVEYAWMMPDTHVGYSMPVGGVTAFDPKKSGIISPEAMIKSVNLAGISNPVARFKPIGNIKG